MNLLFLSKTSSIAGIDIGTKNIKIVYLKPHKEKFFLEKYAILTLPDEITKQDVLPETRVPVIVELLKEFLAKNKSFPKKVAVSISGPSVVVRYIKIPVMTKQEIEKSITIEAEPYIPFTINEVNITFDIIGEVMEEGVKKNEVVIVAAKKELVDRYINLLKSCGLTPAYIDVDIFALEITANYCYDIKNDVIMIVNIGESLTNVGIIENGVTKVCRDLPFGGVGYIVQTIKNMLPDLDISLINDYLKTYGIISSEEKERYLQEDKKEVLLFSKNLSAVLKDIVAELHKVIDFFYFQKEEQRSISKIYLSGGGSVIKNLDNYISSELGISTEKFSPFNNIENSEIVPQDIHPLFSVAVGLALKGYLYG